MTPRGCPRCGGHLTPDDYEGDGSLYCVNCGHVSWLYAPLGFPVSQRKQHSGARQPESPHLAPHAANLGVSRA